MTVGNGSVSFVRQKRMIVGQWLRVADAIGNTSTKGAKEPSRWVSEMTSLILGQVFENLAAYRSAPSNNLLRCFPDERQAGIQN